MMNAREQTQPSSQHQAFRPQPPLQFARPLRLAALALVAALALLPSGCGGISGNVGNAPVVASATVPQVQHVVIVTLENANYTDVLQKPDMPYLLSLLPQGALVGQYYANSHPSIPNYFMMTTGQAITNDDDFVDSVTTDNVARELTASGKSWKVYAESLPSVGYLAGDKGLYLRHHNPFSYFSDVQQSLTLAANIVPFDQFAPDIVSTPNTLPNYSFIVPNVLNDAHSCTDGSTISCALSTRLARADDWLKSNLSPLLASPAFQQSGLLVIVFDESQYDITNGGGHVAALLVGTHVRPGYIGNTTSYDHRSLLSLSLRSLGVTTIPNGAGNAPQMTEFFK